MPSWQSSMFSEWRSGIIMNSFSKSLYCLNVSIWLIISFAILREIWSKLNASASPLKIFRDNWSQRIIVPSLPYISYSQCFTTPWPISIKSCLNNKVISSSVYGFPPNHLFIIPGGILEFLSHILLGSVSECGTSSILLSSFLFGLPSTLLMLLDICSSSSSSFAFGDNY